MEPVLNELSIEPAPVATRDRVSTLVQTLRALDEVGFSRVLRHVREALDANVGEGESLRQALISHPSRDERAFLLGRVTKAPFVEDLHGREEGRRNRLIEGTVCGIACAGPLIAFLRDVPVVSLRGLERHEADTVTVAVRSIRDGDEDGELVEERDEVEVPQLASPLHVAHRKQELRARVLRAVSSGRELWARRTDLFARVDFAPRVEQDIADLTAREDVFGRVVNALAALQSALAEWRDGPLPLVANASVESESTLKHSDYGPKRDFECSDGTVRRFSLHIKLKAVNWRVYYLDHRAVGTNGVTEARAHLGYIGPHLPTAKYPT